MHDDFFNLLHTEHLMIDGLLGELADTERSNITQRDSLFNQVKLNLIPHMRGEEVAFYTRLLEQTASHEDALEALEEHHAAERVLNELDITPKQADNWGAKVSVLKDMIDHHVQEEETTIFDDARKYLSHEQMGDIMNYFQQEEGQVKNTLIGTRAAG